MNRREAGTNHLTRNPEITSPMRYRYTNFVCVTLHFWMRLIDL